MKTLLSLYDHSGNWAAPFARAGWNVILWDIKHVPDMFSTFKDIKDASAEYIYQYIFDNYGTIDGMLIAQPCTDFAVSGARWFKDKDASGQTAESIELVKQSLRIVDLCMPDFWCLENPISRIHKLVPELGNPRMYFNPCDFGEPYTKKTALWGAFNPHLKKTIVLPTEGSKMHTQYGGKSERTKALRSVTPPGFAEAFFEANHWWRTDHWEYMEDDEDYMMPVHNEDGTFYYQRKEEYDDVMLKQYNEDGTFYYVKQ